MKRIALAIILLSMGISARADDVVWPLDCKPQITSSFGEFRVGHFHAGIDFRTPKGEGMPIFAPSDGEVVRVRQTPWGYGKVLYYRMSGNRIVIFGHMSRFAEAIEKRVLKEQLEKRSNAVEIWLKKGELPFSAGDTIGFSGSSGAGSPHLHFELRDGFDSPFNPRFAGYVVKDDIAPTIAAVWAVPFGNNANIDGHYRPVRFDVGGKDTLRFAASGKFYLAIEAFDLESAENKNRSGLYDISMDIDAQPAYRFFADTFSYSRTRQIGLLYDLGLQEEFHLKRPPFRLFHPFGADVSLLKGTSEGSGIFDATEDTISSNISLADVSGNRTTLNVVVAPRPPTPTIDIEIIDDADGLSAKSALVPDDTSGLRFEYSVAGRMLRDRMPIEGKPTALPEKADFARVRGFGRSLWFWRPTEDDTPAVDCSIPGADYILIKAAFKKPPAARPTLRFGDEVVFPEQESDTLFVFRLFGAEPEQKLALSYSGGEVEFDPKLFAVEDGARIELAGGRARLDIPKGAIFTPFVATESADSSTEISIEPAGVMLRSKARLTFDADSLPNSDEKKLCIVRFWGGDTLFVGASRDKKGDLFATIGAFGDFGVLVDSIPPDLKLQIGQGATVRHHLSASISDNLSGFSNAVLPNSFIDGEWTPTDFDSDKNTIAVDVRRLSAGEHRWLVVAEDVAGNAVRDSVDFKTVLEGK